MDSIRSEAHAACKFSGRVFMVLLFFPLCLQTAGVARMQKTAFLLQAIQVGCDIFWSLQIRTGLSVEQPWNDVLPCFTWTSLMIFCGVTSWRVMWNWMKLGCPFVIVMVSLWRSQEMTSGLTLRARPAPHQSNPFQRPTAFWKFHVDFGWLRSTSYLL